MVTNLEYKIDEYIKDKNENSLVSTINKNLGTDIKGNEDRYAERQKLYLKENKTIWEGIKLQFLELKLSIFDTKFKPFIEELKSLKESIGGKQDERLNKNAKFDINDEEFKKSTKEIYNNIVGNKPSWDSFLPAYLGYKNLSNKIQNDKYLTIVDFSKSNDDNRLYVIDLKNNNVDFCTKAGHGENSGDEYASDFSNQSGSHQSSLGFMLTGTKYEKNSKGTREGLRLYGVEEGINDQTDERGIFIHPGGIESSEGCLTIPKDESKKIMDNIIGKSLIFSYFPDNNYFAQSDVLKKTPNQTEMA